VTAAMEAWDREVAKLNAEAVMQVWHTSESWLRNEAEGAIFWSGVWVGAAALGSLFLLTLLTTLSWRLAVAVLFSVTSIMGWALAFMVEGAGWKIGVVETIALLAALAVAEDCAIQVVRRYGSCCIFSIEERPARESRRASLGRKLSTLAQVSTESSEIVLKCGEYTSSQLSRQDRNLVAMQKPAERHARTRHALQTLALHVPKTAVTFLASLALMLPCVLGLFRRTAWTLLGAVIVSLGLTLGQLPALLLVMGPTALQEKHKADETGLQRRSLIGGAGAKVEVAKSLYVRKLRPRLVGLVYSNTHVTATRVLASG